MFNFRIQYSSRSASCSNCRLTLLLSYLSNFKYSKTS
uniref:Uncharacterized protein n=1 Tax=CrAss-like virus sp. ctYsL76 TaxID=2826826 RepID=A0A8S5QMS8_9CAUD|nr:MAG TPA: hypothetical protein [CrAss-like virus sp. ctYsL76]